MTDTVNVPREPTLGMIHAAERVGSALAGSDASSGEITAAVWAAMLAAAPKAEPVSDPYKLEAVKHLITTRLTLHDTDVTLGGVDRVAADIIAMLMTQPEAPKVEQEPCPERGMGVCDCSQCHRAPASDELLKVVAKDAAERVHKNGGCVPQLAYAPILFALQDALTSGAKS